jgi:hypothetical protein
MLVKGCKKCCLSSVTHRTVDDTLCNGNKEDRNVRSEREEDEGTDCEDRDSDAD